MKHIVEALMNIQSELKAPKNQRNNFGGYNYRSCEDIMEAVKPLLAKNGVVLTVCDDIEMLGNRVYVKAIATLTDGEDSIANSAFAREAETKKGMDDSQITGATSSYARKYALNGLFCIDDTKDADATNTHGKEDNQFQKEVAKDKAKATKEFNKKVEEYNKSPEGLKIRYESCYGYIKKLNNIEPYKDRVVIDKVSVLLKELSDNNMKEEYDNLEKLMNEKLPAKEQEDIIPV